MTPKRENLLAGLFVLIAWALLLYGTYMTFMYATDYCSQFPHEMRCADGQ